MKRKFVNYFMTLAAETAKLSSARRLKVGSVIVRDGQILATGYNGTPSGWDNNCEYEEEVMMSQIGKGTWMEKTGQLKTKPEVLHSESNALMKIARSTESSVDATMFCTHAPCLQCAKLIYQSGITKLYYRDTYRDTSGVEFLRKGGVDVEQYSDQD